MKRKRSKTLFYQNGFYLLIHLFHVTNIDWVNIMCEIIILKMAIDKMAQEKKDRKTDRKKERRKE